MTDDQSPLAGATRLSFIPAAMCKANRSPDNTPSVLELGYRITGGNGRQFVDRDEIAERWTDDGDELKASAEIGHGVEDTVRTLSTGFALDREIARSIGAGGSK